jgi:NAD(P)-dependent dehydrogenase (short-subunit alcohol dehydrogenase family)
MPTHVITGATGALGSAIAEHLVSIGHSVAIIGTARSTDRLDALARKLGSTCLPIEGTVDDAESWATAIARIEAELGAITGAALVAGSWRGGAPLHEEKDETVWRAMLDDNLETAHAALRALLPGMIARTHGSIVVVASRAAVRPETSKGAAAYAASKAAVVALTQAVAAETAEHFVRVNAVLPSTINTAANRAAIPNGDPSKWVTPESIARVITFLLSDDARDVSGAALPIYGRA